MGGTLTGASWSDVSTASLAELDTNSTAITGGTTIAAAFVTGQTGQSAQVNAGSLSSDLRVASDYDGVSDILTLAVYPISNTVVTGGVLSWREIR